MDFFVSAGGSVGYNEEKRCQAGGYEQDGNISKIPKIGTHKNRCFVQSTLARVESSKVRQDERQWFGEYGPTKKQKQNEFQYLGQNHMIVWFDKSATKTIWGNIRSS